ncbi:unnamed protein product [Arabidopsis thaliana]|uniref:Uncharacterized protein n=1 Tax=Arabidopsis thaliana TaxID=3702 RepID=A0A654G501_ARATH|nr:unnamed protein product [Arabidopsis thaliana]
MDGVIKSVGSKWASLWASNGLRMGLLFSSLSDAQDRGGGRVGWLTEWSRLLLGLCDRVSVSAVRIDWFFSSPIEYNWWTGKVDCLNGLPGVLCDRLEVSGWTAELTASLSATGDRNVCKTSPRLDQRCKMYKNDGECYERWMKLDSKW